MRRYTSKSSRYNVMMRYVLYSLHARLRFSSCVHEHSTARSSSASRAKMWGRVSFVTVVRNQRDTLLSNKSMSEFY